MVFEVLAWKVDDFWRVFVASIAGEWVRVKNTRVSIVPNISEIFKNFKISRSKIFLQDGHDLSQKTIQISLRDYNREPYGNQWFRSTGRTCYSATYNRLVLQKNFRFGKNEIFEIFRNVVDDAHASIFDPCALPRDVSNPKPLKTYDFLIQKQDFPCQNTVLLVRTSPQ